MEIDDGGGAPSPVGPSQCGTSAQKKVFAVHYQNYIKRQRVLVITSTTPETARTRIPTPSCDLPGHLRSLPQPSRRHQPSRRRQLSTISTPIRTNRDCDPPSNNNVTTCNTRTPIRPNRHRPSCRHLPSSTPIRTNRDCDPPSNNNVPACNTRTPIRPNRHQRSRRHLPSSTPIQTNRHPPSPWPYGYGGLAPTYTYAAPWPTEAEDVARQGRELMAINDELKVLTARKEFLEKEKEKKLKMMLNSNFFFK